MRRKSNNTIIVVLLILVVLALAVLGGMIWFINSHIFVGGKPYAKDAQILNLRDRKISMEEYFELRESLPDSEILWSVPFQDGAYPDDTTALKVTSLSDEDLQMLSYFTDLTAVDATGCRDYDKIQSLKEQYPNVKVTYTVNIGGEEYPQDAGAVVCHTLTDDEINLMKYLPELKKVDASDCKDYDQIGALTQAIPGLEVTYQVEMMGKTFTEKDTEASFSNVNVEELQQKLAWLPHMEKIHLHEPAAAADSLRQLMDTYPNITFTWEKTVLGKTFNSAETIYDLTDAAFNVDFLPGWRFEDPDAGKTQQLTAAVEEAMAYFPNAEKVILPSYKLDNTVMSDFRERMRPEYKVVWTVYVTRKPVRTDQEVIHSSAYSVCFIDEQSQDLVYCEDAIVVDIGHSYVKDISWLRGMPKLKYLILTHNWVKDLTPVSTCKNLVYLELFWNDYIPDYTPILGCTALEDLNISATFADIEPLYQMTWLKNLWANCKGITAAEDAALKAALPNTTVMTTGGSYTSGGWRQVQGYYDMRDIMGLPYNTW